MRINCVCLLNIFLPFLKVSADIPCRNLYSKLSFVRASHCLKIRRKIFRRFQMPSASPMLLISVRSLRSRLGFHRSNIGRIFKRLFFFTIGKIARIAQSRNNVRMFVEFGIDGSAPDCRLVFRKYILYMIDSLLAGDN